MNDEARRVDGETVDAGQTSAGADVGAGVDAGATRLPSAGVMSVGATPPGRRESADGARLGPFRVLRELGAGGMGAVLQVRDDALGRAVAAKVAHSEDPDQLDLFVEEARVTGQLEHPNIVPVYSLGADVHGQPFFTMKEVGGRDLSKLLAEEADVPLPRMLAIFAKICDAVGFAHSKQVVHRDLKPANVMVGAFGEVLVMDWGLAKRLELVEAGDVRDAGAEPSGAAQGGEARTLEGSVKGTPGYMSPEQARGEVARIDARTDIYALGAILYRMLAGVAPYRGRSVLELLSLAADNDFAPPSRREDAREVPRELEAVILKAMAAAPEDRYPTTGALAADIERYLEGRLVGAARYGAAERLWKWLRRHRVAVGLVAAVLLTWLAALGWRHVERQRRLGAALAEIDRREPAALLTAVRDAIVAARRQPRRRPTVEEKRAIGDRIDQLMAVSKLRADVLRLRDDRAARAAQRTTLLAIYRLALIGEDFSLARAMVSQLARFETDDEVTRERLAVVDTARTARVAREQAAVARLLAQVRAGQRSTPDELTEAKIELASYGGRHTVLLLRDALLDLVGGMRAAQEAALLEVGQLEVGAEVRRAAGGEEAYGACIGRALDGLVPSAPRPASRPRT